MLKKKKESALPWHRYVKNIADSFFDLVFPPVCGSCKKTGGLICPDCLNRIKWVKEPICQICGRYVADNYVKHCTQCQQIPNPLEIRAAVLFAQPVQGLIHKMKYENMFGLARPLADLMSKAWLQWETSVDLVVPIPLHPTRMQQRGYNQSEKLAQYFCQSNDFVLASSVLMRIRDTLPQVGLNSKERAKNVQAAFVAKGERIKDKNILLIDDVCTTGATLASAAYALQKEGAKKVSAYCLARAM